MGKGEIMPYFIVEWLVGDDDNLKSWGGLVLVLLAIVVLLYLADTYMG